MTLCCDLFDSLINEAGKAGLAIVVKDCGPVVGFFFQARTHDLDQEEKFLRMPRASDPPRPFYVVMEQGFNYCPFCGTDLDTIRSQQANELAELVLKHEPFVRSPHQKGDNS
jgi:hypothetical protein